jgi:hypothetical protein
MLLTPALFVPASGLRLETARETDKEKSEFYFRSQIKKFLTKNPVPNCRERFTMTPKRTS